MEKLANKQISVSELDQLLKTGQITTQLIDVRTAAEFAGEHIEGALNIPLDILEHSADDLNRGQDIILICRSGQRAAMAAQRLHPLGFKTEILSGGINEWSKSGAPLVNGRKVLSLERQTQLTIGIILLTSEVLGWSVNKWFLAIPALIGAGLTFAGLSGTCGLALIISKAPWNK